MKYIFSMFSLTYLFTSLLSYHLSYVLVTVLYSYLLLHGSCQCLSLLIMV